MCACIHGGLQGTGQVIQTAPGYSREMRTSKASTPYSPVGFILMTVRVKNCLRKEGVMIRFASLERRSWKEVGEQIGRW